MVGSVRWVGCGVLVAVAGACAHGGTTSDHDPVVETMLVMSDLADADRGAVCASDRVEADRSLEALRTARSERVVTRARPSAAWVAGRGRDMNLSQASELTAQSVDRMQAEARSTEPGAGVRRARAMAFFEAYSEITSDRGVRSLRPGQPSPSEVRWAAADFATVWSDYFQSPEGSDEQALALDWLTGQAMAHPEMLVDYKSDFDRALNGLCLSSR